MTVGSPQARSQVPKKHRRRCLLGRLMRRVRRDYEIAEKRLRLRRGSRSRGTAPTSPRRSSASPMAPHLSGRGEGGLLSPFLIYGFDGFGLDGFNDIAQPARIVEGAVFWLRRYLGLGGLYYGIAEDAGALMSGLESGVPARISQSVQFHAGRMRWHSLLPS
jgi:hypothetical protein